MSLVSGENPYAVTTEHKDAEEHAKFIEKQRSFMIKEAKRNDNFRNRMIALAREARNFEIL